MRIIRETFTRPGDDGPTHRHYLIDAGTPEQALQIVKSTQPYRRAFAPGVLFGLVPGSQLTVVQ